ncbi:hypothetical protein QUB30_26475 [Microcoleus sp. BROC3]
MRSTLFDIQAMQSTTQSETESAMDALKHGLPVTIITGFLGID